jgi:hypothetical protein
VKTKTMRIFIFVMVFLFAFGCVASVLAQGETKPVQPAPVQPVPAKVAPVEKILVKEGEMVSIDSATNTLTLKHLKTTETFKLDPKVIVKKAGKVITTSGLVAGEKIRVIYKEVSGEKIATKIMVGTMYGKKHLEATKKEVEPKTK